MSLVGPLAGTEPLCPLRIGQAARTNSIGVAAMAQEVGNGSVFSEIVLNNVHRERQLSKYACRSSRGIRKQPERESTPDRRNIRPVFFHDTDKIIHSHAYARYIDKTQLFYLFENDHITHRVLHVQFVAKIGRVIGRCLGLNEDLIEAIALGHDLGHAPFGHDGERVLDELCDEHGVGAFRHNAQSVRALMELEQHGRGVNLSLQVLDGILAHNGELPLQEYIPQYGKTWPQFEDEYRACLQDRAFSANVRPMTLEGCVMRVTDIIAYLGRDIEDALSLRILTADELPWDILGEFGVTSESGINRGIIDRLVLDLVENSYGKDHLLITPGTHQAVQALLKWNYEHICANPLVKTPTLDFQVRNMFTSLFDRYLGHIEHGTGESPSLDAFLADMGSDYRACTPPARIAADFIAGMTDDFLRNQFTTTFVPGTHGYRLDRPVQPRTPPI